MGNCCGCGSGARGGRDDRDGHYGTGSLEVHGEPERCGSDSFIHSLGLSYSDELGRPEISSNKVRSARVFIQGTGSLVEHEDGGGSSSGGGSNNNNNVQTM